MTMLKMETNLYHDHHHHHMDLPSSDPFLSNTAADVVDQKTSLGFMELLGFQDYYSHSSIFDSNTSTFQQLPLSNHHLNEDGNDNGDNHKEEEFTTTVDEESSSVVLNGQPSSPNSSSICTSPARQRLHNNNPLKQCVKEKKPMCGDEAKAKKQKKEKAPRFAFMTRTEIDHLDDGYRWRKYGQKAVKNSRFPRSYYRCTNASCNVKKRVERCMGDPSFVITTYEGQHTHPVTANHAPLIPSYNHLITTAAFAATTPPPAMLKLDQGGLLQDMLSCHQR
ncbi:hypothetical protein L1987_76769 [Smallanthus sonchifolius]|uniref:Uncharacterized protein n=1 Tax=Smallanthus sonchifolius TaxID=185202 RepID=A0ACB8Z768_9ASTR|nr:hypothetical protein L1987_76769 [Smallanthus sonchifolius]